MLRRVSIGLGLSLLLIATGSDARAQYGYGGYYGGWGGWGGAGSTAYGSIAQGMGQLYAGAGAYNEQTAVARSINTDTAIRFNQYIYLGQQESERKYLARKNAAFTKNNTAYNEILKRIQDQPTQHDIDDGDALNAILDQLHDPRINSSALRSASGSIDAKLISQIPFRSATEAITVVMSQLKTATHWPAAFQEERFAADRKAYDVTIEQARQEDEEGDVAPETIAKLKSIISSIKSKLAAQPIADPAAAGQAQNFLKALTALTRLLEKPDTRAVLNELKNIKTASAADLFGFMHAFNLRFGPATTPQQRLVYAQIYPTLDQTRDKIMGAIKSDSTSTAQADPKHLTDFFSNVPDHAIEGKPAPQPPKPQP
jgi:hypothetical protein